MSSSNCPLPYEAGGNDYPASWLDVVSEPLRYPGAEGRDECRRAIPSLHSTPGHSELKKHLELCHGSCCVLRFFAAAPVGKADPGSRLGSRTEPPGHAVDDPEGWTFPAPRQRAGLRPGWRPRGLPRPMHEAEEAKTTPEPSEVMKQLLDELRRAQETNRKAVQKEVFPEGSRSSLPGSGEAAEAMPAAGMPGLPRPRGYQPSSLNEFHWTNSGSMMQIEKPGGKKAAAPCSVAEGPDAAVSLRATSNSSSHCLILEIWSVHCRHNPHSPPAHTQQHRNGGTSPAAS
ncbi:uncharacterized protein [Patagioenas fasciata]|uniref:uncharacterized protein n=1 Tax=Patagioenas fasciata TaxID=372321 RepID=UPI003A9A4195